MLPNLACHSRIPLNLCKSRPAIRSSSPRQSVTMASNQTPPPPPKPTLSSPSSVESLQFEQLGLNGHSPVIAPQPRSTPSPQPVLSKSSPSSSPRLAIPAIMTPSSSPRMQNGPPPEPPKHLHPVPSFRMPPSQQSMPPPPPPSMAMSAPPQHMSQPMAPPQHMSQPMAAPQHMSQSLAPPSMGGPQYQQPAPVGLDPAYMYHRPESFYGGNVMPQPLMRPPQQNPWRNSFHAGLEADSQAYMPDSSLLAASQAGKQPKQSQFPPPTLENLNKFRKEAKDSNNPQQLLDMAKFMLEAVPQICKKEKDPQRVQKIREALTTEAYKTVKKLANTSGIGKAGYSEAQYFLAMKYMQERNSMGLAKDADKAFSLFMQGAKQSHPACNYRVAVCYEIGAGTKKDKGHAIQYYRKAANLGDPPAMYKLGMTLLKGLLGQSKNPREGISWLKRATQHADQDLPHAFHELGLAYEKEGIPSVIPDQDYSRDLFTQAAQYGYAPSQFKLGLAYENGFLNCPIDPRRSIAWYSKAAEQGHLEAELSLSGWYLTGADGILKQSDAEAYLWARKAADRGYSKGEYAVGYYTETGIGVRQNLDEAKKWYMRAAAQNNKRAMQRLAELKKAGKNKPKQRRQHTRTHGRPADDGKDGDCIVM